jgi:hypothetical protein
MTDNTQQPAAFDADEAFDHQLEQLNDMVANAEARGEDCSIYNEYFEKRVPVELMSHADKVAAIKAICKQSRAAKEVAAEGDSWEHPYTVSMREGRGGFNADKSFLNLDLPKPTGLRFIIEYGAPKERASKAESAEVAAICEQAGVSVDHYLAMNEQNLRMAMRKQFSQSKTAATVPTTLLFPPGFSSEQMQQAVLMVGGTPGADVVPMGDGWSQMNIAANGGAQ